MKQAELSHLVDPLREMLYQYDMFTGSFCERNGFKRVGYVHELLPQEILYSFGFLPVRIPSALSETMNNDELVSMLTDSFDYAVVPESLKSSQQDNIFACSAVSGYGKDSAVSLHETIEKFLKITGTDIRKIDIPVLQQASAKYNTMRSLVRGISLNRKSKPGLLSNSDLFVIFQAASAFPPDLTADYLANILKNINETKNERADEYISCMVYAEDIADAGILDTAEDEGFLVSEDDSSSGRRQFDVSLNPESEYIYYEILDAFTYKPLAPGHRTKEERYELLYKMLKSYGIELVIFLEDCCSENTAEERDYLRIKLMRSGVDPLAVTKENIREKLREYKRYC